MNALCSFIISYYICSVFLEPFKFVNKSILMCYFIDEEMFYGDQSYMEPFIFDIMEFYNNVE